MPKKNSQLEIFRLKIDMLMSQWMEKMKIFIVENRLAGFDSKAIGEMRKDPESKWNLEREALNKRIKSEVAGLLNKVHIKAYMKEL